MIRLLDISRLVENLHFAAPTGIERVEIAYAQHFLQRAGEAELRFVVTWPHATGILRRADAEPLIARTAARWSESAIADDAALAEVQQRLRAPIRPGDPTRPQRIAALPDRRGADDWRRLASVWLRSRLHPVGRHIEDLRRAGACYINVSQFRLHRPRRFAWLTAAQVAGVFMLHDLIPILYPEYCRPGEAQRHRVRLDTMLRHAAIVVANSQATRDALAEYVAASGRPMPRCEVVSLGTPATFTQAAAQPAATPATPPYFVTVGTIEPRKNLLFLLTLWHRWTQGGMAAPARLIVVGRRGWENDNILDLLDRSAGLGPSVIEVNGLSDSGMAALLRGARALIAPSFVEGYGLPVAEALALGVPVLASDIAAHREVGGDLAEYLNPLDGKAWMQAFDDYCAPASSRRQAALTRLAGYRPIAWDAHLARIEDIIATLAAQRRTER